MTRKNITRADLVESLVRKGLARIEGSDLVDQILTEISEALVRGEDVTLVNFGRIKVLHKNERLARNPVTGEPAMVSPRRSISFGASRSLKIKVQVSHRNRLTPKKDRDPEQS